MPSPFRLREKAFDFCNIAMTVTVIALSVLFFLSFQQPTPVVATIPKVNALNGDLLPGSCSYGSLSQSAIFRSDNSSVMLLTKIDATILSRMNFTGADIQDPSVAKIATECTSFEVQREFVPQGGSGGRYRVIRKADPRPNEICVRWSITRGDGYYLAGFFRGSEDLVENCVVESKEPIDAANPVGITVYMSSFQLVSGPLIDLNAKVSAVYDFTDIIRVRMPELQFSCEYKPFFEVSSAAFGLNVASILVAILCLIVQMVHFQGKHMHHDAGGAIKNELA
jgi:hypothetical protein